MRRRRIRPRLRTDDLRRGVVTALQASRAELHQSRAMRQRFVQQGQVGKGVADPLL